MAIRRGRGGLVAIFKGEAVLDHGRSIVLGLMSVLACSSPDNSISSERQLITASADAGETAPDISDGGSAASSIPPIAPDLVGVNARELRQLIVSELPTKNAMPSAAAEHRLDALMRAYSHRRSMSPPEVRGQIDYDNNPGLSISQLHGGQP